MRKLIRFLLIVALGAACCLYRAEIKGFYNLVMGRFPEIEEVTANVSKEFASDLESLKREVITPEPLRLPAVNQRAFLTVSGTIVETNAHRSVAGLAALKGNAKLAAAAQKRLRICSASSTSPTIRRKELAQATLSAKQDMNSW